MIAEYSHIRDQPLNLVGPDQPNQSQADGSRQIGGLVLARQVGESIRIGNSIVIEVLALKTSTARLRICAPQSVAVHRREVYDAIRLSLPLTTPESKQTHAADESVKGGGLVLTRKAGQTLMIGDEIAVDVVEARPGVVRLRIIAPRTVPIHRSEVYDSIRRSSST